MNIYAKIRQMLRTKKLCEYLRDYDTNIHSNPPFLSAPYTVDGVPSDDFFDYVASLEHKTSYGQENALRAEIGDRITEGFFEHPIFRGAIVGGNPDLDRVILSAKGRKLVTGIPVLQWWYFIQFLFEQQKLLYSIVVGILSIIAGIIIGHLTK